MHALPAFRAGQAAGARAGGHHEGVVAHPATVGQEDLTGGGVQTRGARAQAQVQVKGPDGSGIPQPQPVGLPRAGRQLLGQRRPIVRETLPLTDEGQTPCVRGRAVRRSD